MPTHQGRDSRYHELSHTRQVRRAQRKTSYLPHNWQQASHTVERFRAWRQIIHLVEVHQLNLQAVGRYMSTPAQWRVLEARFLERPMPSYAMLGRRLQCTLEAVDSMEARGLLACSRG